MQVFNHRLDLSEYYTETPASIAQTQNSMPCSPSRHKFAKGELFLQNSEGTLHFHQASGCNTAVLRSCTEQYKHLFFKLLPFSFNKCSFSHPDHVKKKKKLVWSICYFINVKSGLGEGCLRGRNWQGRFASLAIAKSPTEPPLPEHLSFIYNFLADTKQMVVLSEHSIERRVETSTWGVLGWGYFAPCRSNSLNTVVRYLFTAFWSACQDWLPQYNDIHVHNWMPLSTAPFLCTDIHAKRALNTFTTHTKRFRLFRASWAWPCTGSLSKLSLCSSIPSLPA